MNLAIVSTNKEKYSETFIYNHVKLLPAKIFFLFQGYLPTLYSLDKGLTVRSVLDYSSKKWLGLVKKRFENDKAAILDALRKFLIKNKIEAILCEYGPSGVEMMELSVELNIPLIVHFHGYDAYRDDVLNTYGKKYRQLFEIARNLIVVSKHMYNQLIDLGCEENKLSYLPYGIDTGIFKPLDSVKGKYTFVACGRFVAKKGPMNTIKAFDLLLKKCPDAKLIMIGDGLLLDDCKFLVSTLGIQNKVEFTGALSQIEISKIFSQCLAFVQHSVTTPNNDAEGTPLVILEAMSAGLPVIATKHGGIVDVVFEEVTGYLVNENDVAAMADKMHEVIVQPQFALQMGKNASIIVSDYYSLNSYTQSLFELIKSAINLKIEHKNYLSL